MKIKCIIVEDEPKAMSLMEEHINKTTFLELSSKFHNALEAINFIDKQQDVNLAFLDINLPELSGMEMSKMIDPGVKIIFTTAYSDYAVHSYEVNTVDYLLKPITYNRFLQAALKAQKLIEKERKEDAEIKIDSYVFLKSGKKIIQINWEDIYYIEGLKEYLSIVTTTQKIVIYKRMSEFEAIQPRTFKRVHNSFIVNLDKIEKVEDNTIHILKRQIPISKSYKDDFFSSIKGRII